MEAISPTPAVRRLRLQLAALSLLEVAWTSRYALVLAWPVAGFVWGSPSLPRWVIWIPVTVVASALAWFWFERARRVERRPPEVEGLIVPMAQVPALTWLVQPVEEALVGGRLGELAIVGEPEVAVLDAAEAGACRRLVVGLPLLVGATRDELQALIVTAAVRHRCEVELTDRVDQVLPYLRGLALNTTLRGRSWWPSKRIHPWLLTRYERCATELASACRRHAELVAARMVGAEASAAGELRRTLLLHQLDELWQEVWDASDSEEDPPTGVFRTITRRLRSGREERPAAPASDTAELLIPADVLVRAEAELERLWREAARDQWESAHERTVDARRRLAELDDCVEPEQLDTKATLDLATLRERFTGEDTTELYRAAVEADPADATANYHLGRRLLAADDDAGLLHLSLAMDADEDAVPSACELAVAFLERQGRTGEAMRYRERAVALTMRREAALVERAPLRPDDILLPPQASPPFAAALVTELRAQPGVKRAYLVRKHVEHYADTAPLHVLVVVRRRRPFSLRLEADLDRALADELSLTLGGLPWLIVYVVSTAQVLDARIRQLPGALVYVRPRGVVVPGLIAVCSALLAGLVADAAVAGIAGHALAVTAFAVTLAGFVWHARRPLPGAVPATAG